MTDTNGNPIVYDKLQKVLYRLLKSSLLFYKKLLSDSDLMGFELNPYDPCVTNKIKNGKQMMIIWHINNLKISHVDLREVKKSRDKSTQSIDK